MLGWPDMDGFPYPMGVFSFDILVGGSGGGRQFIPLYLFAPTFEGIVMWGDGSVEEVAWNPPDPFNQSRPGEYLAYARTITHNYTADGSYTVTLMGDLSQLLGFDYWTKPSWLTKVNTVFPATMSEQTNFSYVFSFNHILTSVPGKMFKNCPNAVSCESMFEECLILPNVPSDIFEGCENVESFAGCFLTCQLFGAVSEDLFKDCVNAKHFGGCFSSINIPNTWSSNLSIPGGLFANCPLAEDFTQCFSDSYLSALPSGLFSHNPNAVSFEGCFYSNRIPVIPADLFANCPKAKNFNSCFEYSRELTYIPSGLFDNCPLAEDFGSCFSYCFYEASSYSAAIPAGLFDHNPMVKSFSGTFWDSMIPYIPNGLFDHNPLVEDFSWCFGRARITTIPSDLFDNNPVVTDFSGCFEDCSGITDDVPTLWLDFPNADGDYCFNGCTRATNYNSIPSDWGGPA